MDLENGGIGSMKSEATVGRYGMSQPSYRGKPDRGIRRAKRALRGKPGISDPWVQSPLPPKQSNSWRFNAKEEETGEEIKGEKSQDLIADI